MQHNLLKAHQTSSDATMTMSGWIFLIYEDYLLIAGLSLENISSPHNVTYGTNSNSNIDTHGFINIHGYIQMDIWIHTYIL